ncbi:MAG TPA: S24 family peptidase [Anaerolineae bacterium]|nr:S24 family peptidase [Anaerolineae bacterium]
MTQLDEHGARILAFVECYQRKYHRSPSYREIGAAVGLASSDHVARDLRRLVELGYLSFTPGISRSIVLLKTPQAQIHSNNLRLPNFNTPRAAVPASDGLDELAASLFQDEKDTFILRARGEALRDAELEEGDLIVIKRGEAFREGDMLALWLKNERRTALKYVYHENGRLRLHSANEALPPDYVKSSDVEIRGTVLAIIRKRGT